MTSSPPPHWDNRRLKSLARIVNGGTPSSTVPEYWDGNIIWLTPDDLGKLNTAYVKTGARSITQEGYNSCSTTLAPAGSIVVSTRAPIGHTAILEADACVNQGCRILVPDKTIQTRYLYRSLTALKHELETRGKGTTFAELSHGDLGTVPILVPPPSEQASIVHYLDHADELINRYISAKERLIALMEEQRQAVIQQFITRGLDLTVHLKPSGGEWFGEMPEHWEIRRLAELHLDVTSGTWGEEPTGAGDIACVRVADFDRHHLRAKTDNPTMRHVSNQEVARKRLAKGDLLLEKSGGGDLQPVGAVVLFDTDIPAVCTNFVARLRPAQICTSKYALAIHSTLYTMRVNTRSIKQTTGIQNLDLDTYFSEIVPLPPLPDQYAIVARIDQETARIDASIERAQHQIDLTKEYRTRLIADVVTGQIDVRNTTVELPGQHL